MVLGRNVVVMREVAGEMWRRGKVLRLDVWIGDFG